MAKVPMADLDLSILDKTQWRNAGRVPLAGDASSRRYVRLTQEESSAILMLDPAPANVRQFLKVGQILKEYGFSAPDILEDAADRGMLILEDFGDDIFAKIIEQNPSREGELYKLAVDFLIDLTKREKPYDLPYFSQSYVLDQNAAFLDFYVPDILGHPLADNARFFFHQIWRELLKLIEDDPEVFLYRDFHAENLVLLDSREGLAQLGLLDFQDAMCGPAAYDLASLLQDVRRQITPAVAQSMTSYYASETNINETALKQRIAILGAHRCLRILGVFTRLAKEQGKSRYIALLPRVIGHLNDNLAHPDLLALKHWIKVTLGAHQGDVQL
jgi:aminoglycoside/choline kinase family phosphotransferase